MQDNPTNIGFILLISTIAAIGGLLFGFDTGVISGALAFISSSFHLTIENTFIKEMIVSAVPIGALIGALLSGKSSNKLGRRSSIIVSAVLFILGTLITSLAFSVYMVMLGRLVMGFAVGLSVMTVPMYLSEVSPPSIRGTAVFLFQLAITIGILVAFIINYIFANDENWRMMFAVAVLPAIVLWVGMLFLPNSPRWLLLKGKKEEAKSILERLGGHVVTTELQKIEASISHKQSSFKELFTRKTFPIALITFGLFVFQQLTGINAILYYTPTVFHSAGFVAGNAAILATVATGVCNVLSTFIGIFLIDRWGRRKLLIFAMVGMFVCLILLGLGYHHVFGAHVDKLMIIVVLAFIFFFATGMGGTPYLIMSELFPLRLRGAGMATASCANWGFNILVSATFLSLINAIGIDNTFILYAVFTLVGLIGIIKLLPETKNISLERIEENLYAGKHMRDLGS